MRQLFLGLTVFFTVTVVHGQTTFQKIFGSINDDGGYSVLQDTDSGYVFTGYWCYGGGFCQNRLFLIKTDTYGNTMWSKFYYTNVGYPGDGTGYSLIKTSDNGFAIAGSTIIYNPSLNPQFYLVKTDSNGDSLWTKYYGGDWSEWWAYSVKQTFDGGFIMAGYTDTIPGMLGNLLLIKTNAVGDSVWSKTYGFGLSRPGIAHSVLEITGGYIVLGFTAEPNGSGNSDIYLIKTNSIGDTIWTKTYSAWNDDQGFSIQKTLDNKFIISGATFSFGAGGYDAYLMKVDSNGNLLWTKTFGGLDNEYGNYVSLTSDGGFIIVGSTESFNTGGGYDVYLIKTDSLGNQQWYKTFGGVNDDYGYSVQQTFDGGYILVGKRGDNIYLIKTDPNGDATSINEIDISALYNQINIYPNPFSTQTILQTDNPFHNATLTVDNCFGQTVVEIKNISGQTIVFNRNNLASGLYFIRLTQDNKVIAVDKLVIADK